MTLQSHTPNAMTSSPGTRIEAVRPFGVDLDDVVLKVMHDAPRLIQLNNASDSLSVIFDRLLIEHAMDEIARPFTPKDKSAVEFFFRKFSRTMSALPLGKPSQGGFAKPKKVVMTGAPDAAKAVTKASPGTRSHASKVQSGATANHACATCALDTTPKA